MDRDRVLGAARIVLALALGAGALVALAVGALVLLLTGRPPDGFNEVEFGPPDTWGGMAGGIAFGLLLLAIAGGLVAAALALLRKWPVRRLLLIPLAVTGLGAALVALSVLPRLGDGRERADCATFEVERADWTSRDPDVRLRSAEAIDRCEALDGWTAAEVQRLLGPQTGRRGPPEGAEGDGLLSYRVRDRFNERSRTELLIMLSGEDVLSAQLI